MKNFKRIICITIIAITLSSNIITTYQLATTVQASAIPGIDSLAYLMQALMSSKGQACGSEEDLFSLTRAFEDLVNNGKYTFYNALQPFVSDVHKLMTGDSINTEEYHDLMYGMEVFLDDYLTSLTEYHGDVPAEVLDADIIVQSACGVPLHPVDKENYFSGKFLENCNKQGYMIFKYTGPKFDDAYEKYYIAVPSSEEFVVKTDDKISFFSSRSGGVSAVDFRYFYLDSPTSTQAWSKNLNSSILSFPFSSYKIVTDTYKFPTYKSYEDYVEKMDMRRTAGLKHDIFGNLAKAFDIPKTIKIGTLEATKKAEEVIAQNPGMTADEINSLVSKLVNEIIMEQQNIKDSVDDNTDEVVTSNSWLGKIYKTLTDVFPSMTAPLDAIQVSASTIAIGVKDMGKAIDNQADKILEGLKPIDILLSGFQELSGFLQRVVTGIGANVQAISQALAKIQENVVTLPGIADVLERIRTTAIGIPKAITDVLSLDIAGLRDLVITLPVAIATEIDKATTVDDAVVDDAVEELTDVWELKLPFIPVIANTFEGIQFTDKIEYPVFKMQCPSVIKRFYKKDYIILFDGKNYAQYFVPFRNLLKVIIWVWFAWAVLNHFRVKFHVG